MTDSNNKITLLTPDDLAELLKVSKATVYKMVEKRAIPFYKIGGGLRFSLSEIREFVCSNKIESVKMQ
jgi:excisionase family DNA binding protein